MAFALSMYRVPYAKTYDEAVALYERAEPWRNGGDDRPLPSKRTRIMGVRMVGEDVVFRYHYTNVIRWRPDGSYTINTGGYGSRSTAEFASHFMPQCDYLRSGALHLRIGDRLYAMPGRCVTVSKTGEVSGSGLGVFRKKTVNRRNAKAMLTELGYYPYAAWHKLMYPMVQGAMPAMWRRSWLTGEEMLECLSKGQETYHDLMMSRFGAPDTVRKDLYRVYGERFAIWDYVDHDHLSYTDNVRLYDVV
jgi:hypothetical protein